MDSLVEQRLADIERLVLMACNAAFEAGQWTEDNQIQYNDIYDAATRAKRDLLEGIRAALTAEGGKDGK